MSVAAIGAVDYAQALDGLSLKQAQLMLTTQGIVGEEQRQILIRQGLIATSDNISAKLTYQALQTTALTKAEQQEMLIEMGLMDKKSKQLLLTNSCTEAELRAQLTKMGYIGTQQDEIVTAILGTGVREKEAISWKVLTTSILESAKAMLVWLATNPVGQMIIAAGVIAVVAGAYDLLTMSVEEAQESLEEFNQACSDLDSATTELQSIDENIKSIQDKGTLSLTDQADLSRLEQEKSLLEKEIQLLERKKELTSEKSNSDAVKAVNDGTYKNGDGFFSRSVDDLTKAIMQGELDSSSSQEYLRERGKKTINDAKIELAEIQRRNMELLGQITGTDEDSQNAKKQLQEYIDYVNKYLYTAEELQKMKFDSFLSENESIKNAFNDLSKNGSDVTSDSIEKLANKFPALKTYMDENGISAETLAAEFAKTSSEAETTGENLNKMTVSLSELEGASDKIKTLGSAFKELSDNGYITTKTLGEIQTATGLSGDEWENYKTKLLNAKSGSSEFNQIMSEMTYKILDNAFASKDLTSITEDEVEAILRENGVVNASAVAHDWLSRVKNKEKATNFELGKTVDETKSKLIEEAKSCGITTAAYAQLVAQEIVFNQNDLDISGKIQKLATLQQALGNTASTAILLNNALSSTNTSGRPERDFYLAVEKYGIKKTANGLYEYNGVVYKAGMDAVNAAMAAEFTKGVNVEIPKVDYSGASSSSGSDKNKPDYEDPTDAIINRINLRSKEIEKQEEEIQNLIEIAELENDYKKQISLTNDLIANRKQRVDELNKANAGLHNEAEYQRNIHTFYNEDGTKSDENLWFDSQGNATEYYNALLNKKGITKEEQEQIKDLFEKLSKYKEAYMDNAEEISDLNKEILKDEKEILDLRTELFDKANDFGSSVLDSRKTILKSYHDVQNSIAEAQHEINKELETSKTMYEWLDEDTRKLLFNQEDYNELSEELLDIQYKADKLQRQYTRDLENSTLETVESITSQYEMQYEMLMKSYEIAKADLEIAKKKQQLNNVLNERNVRMFINGQWQWVASTEDVANAKAELADAEYAKRVEESGLTQQESINNLTKRQDELGVVIKQFENGVIDLDEAIKLAKNAIGSLPGALSSLYSKASMNSFSSVGTVSSGGSSSDSNRNPISANKNGINISTVYIKQKNAKGTGYTQSGSMLAGEDGGEIYIDNNGHLIPVVQPTIFKDIGAGGIVFNQSQMRDLRDFWDLSNIGFNHHNIPAITQRTQTVSSIDNSIHINGMTISEQGNEDWINGLRRYIATH